MSIQRKINKFVSNILGFRDRRNVKIREQLAGLEFSVFSNNCLGGVFLHDAGMRFNSPLVNLAMDGKSFITFLENPHEYVDGEFVFEESGKPFPVGVLKELHVSFVHYTTREQAIEKWTERSKRIIWDNIYVIATGHDGLETPKLMKKFDQLPYENKVMFTHHAWPQYSWAKHVVMLDHYSEMPPLTEFATIKGERIYESAFDLTKWIVQCEKKKSERK